MTRFRFPVAMKLASIWVLWACFAIGTIVWCLLVVMRGAGIADKAGWVQAIGAIIAIAGAAVFPYWHEAAKERGRKERLRMLLTGLAFQQISQLEALHEVLKTAIHDFGNPSINDYLGQHKHLDWAPHVDALQSVPIAELSVSQVFILSILKTAAAFAQGVCQRLLDDRWDIIGEQEISDVAHLGGVITDIKIQRYVLLLGGQPK